MSSPNVQTMRAAHEAFNDRDFDAIRELLAEGFTYRDHARDLVLEGADAFVEFLQGWVEAFSNAEVSHPAYIDGGDVVVAQYTGRGTNDGSLAGMPHTDRELALPFCEILRFDAEGRIESGGSYYDQLSMLIQLGHALPSASVAA